MIDCIFVYIYLIYNVFAVVVKLHQSWIIELYH